MQDYTTICQFSLLFRLSIISKVILAFSNRRICSDLKYLFNITKGKTSNESEYSCALVYLRTFKFLMEQLIKTKLN